MGLFLPTRLWSCFLVIATAIVPSTTLNTNDDLQCSWNASNSLTSIIVEDQCTLASSSERAAQANAWHPWTQKPVCVGSKTTKTSQHCAFVKEDFQGSKSLLIVTNPEVVAGDVSLVEDLDSQWTSIRPPLGPTELPPFNVDTIPGKGLGAVANTSIRSGDIVLREHPVILQLAEVSRSIGRMQALWVLEEGFIRLPREDQERVFNLSRSTGGHILEDIIRTNTFGATLNKVAHFGLFPNVARINHACKPNAITRFSPRTLELQVVAYKDIMPGEELSISYSMLNMLYQDRQQALQEWGFNCNCAICSSSPEVLAISDGHRRRLQEILSELEDPVLAGSPSLVAELVDELEDVIVIEGLTAQAGEFYDVVARAYGAMGEMGKGRMYAELALEKLVRFAGYDDERTAKARAVLLEFGGQPGTG
ncbi:hypothetical protein CORC01_12830 [Colletotrichum orchidophilum]|uniref:SET domain-containing protein n=1 Tax=Colletotrichum orchidophilum TaxID=1209926 RepID=A0A1G4ARS7_9PEZI|nr:uncharacterized protein CORC01_12830 [Colletotrichum orchidophilum]OHE91877.1 hypothetical protein CORC01_12830 [Colletotrichum orchidophilum]